jgi:hypothetical protein
MALLFRSLHRSPAKEALNEEWLILENTGPNPVNAHGCALTVAKNEHQRPRPLGTLDPGFVLHPNEKIRLITGSPAKKSQGKPPEEKEMKNYHLFLREPVLAHPGIVVRVAMRQLELAKATFKPDAPDGLEEAAR